MNTNIILSSDDLADLTRIRARMAEATIAKEKALADYVESKGDPLKGVEYTNALVVCAAICEVQGETLGRVLKNVATIYEPDFDGYSECSVEGCHNLYLPGDYPDHFNPDLCPACQMDPDEAEREWQDELRAAEDSKVDAIAERWAKEGFLQSEGDGPQDIDYDAVTLAEQADAARKLK